MQVPSLITYPVSMGEVVDGPPVCRRDLPPNRSEGTQHKQKSDLRLLLLLVWVRTTD